MIILQKTLFVIALLVLSTQTVRHIYVRWLEPTGSVLDRFEPPVTEDIKKADSLDQLIPLYEEAHQKAEAARASAEKSEDPTVISASHSETEPYKSENLLKEAIRDWESKSKELYELRYFWLSGLAFLFLGIICYRKVHPWLGLTLLIAGFSEMIWATSPSFRGGTYKEFDRLLTNKIIFSLISLALLLIIGWLIKEMKYDREKTVVKTTS
jgi:hypothetical protein